MNLKHSKLKVIQAQGETSLRRSSREYAPIGLSDVLIRADNPPLGWSVVRDDNQVVFVSGSKVQPVLISGCIHGDERLGPAVALALLDELELAATNSVFRSVLAETGVVVVPAANALGFAHNVRLDDGNDPNRDFPYGVEECLLTSTSNLLVKLQREFKPSIIVSLHGGMRSLTYGWGNPLHGSEQTADFRLYRAFAEGLQAAAGHATEILPVDLNKLGAASNQVQEWFYPIGQTGEVVYPVWGGWEDFGYAVGWEKGIVHSCSNELWLDEGPEDIPSALVFLVETDDEKAPDGNLYGQGPRYESEERRLHIARNVAMLLKTIELAAPATMVFHIGGGRYTFAGCEQVEYRTAPGEWQQAECSSMADGKLLTYELGDSTLQIRDTSRHCSAQHEKGNIIKWREPCSVSSYKLRSEPPAKLRSPDDAIVLLTTMLVLTLGMFCCRHMRTRWIRLYDFCFGCRSSRVIQEEREMLRSSSFKS